MNYASIKLSSYNRKSRVTLFIPDKNWKLLEKRKNRLGKTTAEVLEIFLRRYQNAKSLKFANLHKLTVLYQDKGLCLRRCDFEVDSFVWHQFKALARFYNVSMCLLFVHFLKIFGTPKKYNLTSAIKLYEKLRISSKTALRLYKTSEVRIDTS